jgi:hypothetical protein
MQLTVRLGAGSIRMAPMCQLSKAADTAGHPGVPLISHSQSTVIDSCC